MTLDKDKIVQDLKDMRSAVQTNNQCPHLSMEDAPTVERLYNSLTAAILIVEDSKR